MPAILVVGTDPVLLSTRAMVLSTTNADVTEAFPPEIAHVSRANDCDLVFLCHSLSNDERHSVARQVREYWPEVCVIQVNGRRELGLIVPQYADAVVPCDPTMLLIMTERLLAQLPIEVI